MRDKLTNNQIAALLFVGSCFAIGLTLRIDHWSLIGFLGTALVYGVCMIVHLNR